MTYYSNEYQIWIRESVDEPPGSRDWFIHQLNTLSNCTVSQCSVSHECCSVIVEPHFLQRVTGCELEKSPEGTVSLRAFDEYGFDGDDFMSFDSDTQQWIEKHPKAKETKIKWDQQTERNQFLHHYLKTCTDWISSFNNTKKNSPDVHVFARKAPDDHSKLVLICLVTGLYPRDIEMNIRLNRINIQNQTSSGVRHNNDETFQMRSSVKIDRNHRGSYDCRVIHSSLTEQVSVEWDGTCIDCETEVLWFVIAGLAVLVLVLAVIGYCIYKKKKSNDYRYGYDDGGERNMITPVQ
ncbi:class I histocompatibility antigen, F10 alpha chain-like [Carassius carassius]|uniref:class I histocompatibility antigen, F10 alpha chain-like n=1 Tax=Carassius carassius TaxID=217509 RepID=UPI0028692AE3|nr:class I histocompatibility antigen, F10 alpha chain-like [Carassius carassius]